MIEQMAAKIRLLILDVDGVMTDGHIIIDSHGEETKCFHVRDGLGLKMLLKAHIDVVIMTGRESEAVKYRAKELGIREIYQGVKVKDALCDKLIGQKNLKKEQVCCMGDDIPDVPMFNRAGLPIAVADAAPEVRNAARYITKNRGGNGAVREVCELILKAQNRWPEI